MTKSILTSIQPKWLVKILNGEKTIEIRKTMPKCKLPVDVYLYCTKDTKLQWTIGCLPVAWGQGERNERLLDKTMNGRVVAKVTLTKVDQVVYIGSGYIIDNDLARTNAVARKSCLDFKDLHTYLKGEDGYAWHVDNLVIFDKPKELSEFYGIIHYPKGQFLTPDICNYGEGYEEDEEQCLKSFRVNKAPQSWQYVYVKENKLT